MYNIIDKTTYLEVTINSKVYQIPYNKIDTVSHEDDWVAITTTSSGANTYYPGFIKLIYNKTTPLKADAAALADYIIGLINVSILEVEVDITQVGGVDITSDGVPVLSKGQYNATEPSLSNGDYSVVQLNDKGQLKVTGGASSVTAEFLSPNDFTAVFLSSTTVTLGSLPFSISDSSQLVYVKVVPATGDASIYVNGSDGVTLTFSGTTLTIAGAGTPFTTGDVYEVGINAQKKAFDSSTNSNLTSVLNPDPDHQTDALPLQASALAIAANTTWYTIGSSVPCATYNKGKVYITYTDAGGGDALNLRFRILFKDENGGQESPANESFVTITGVATTFDGVIANNYYECTEDGSAVICIHLELDNTVGEFEIEASCSDIGTGDDPTITATYRLGY